MNLGQHADFVVASYAIAVVVIGCLIGWVALDHRAQRRRLAELEASGATRRSNRAIERPA